MHGLLAIVASWVFAAIGFGFIVWLFIRAFKKTDEPVGLLLKWILTALVLAFMVLYVAPIVAKGDFGSAFVGIPLTAVCGLVFAIIWRHAIAAAIAKPFVDIYTGGDREPDPKPFYSIAISKRKRGHYAEAMADIRKELERFPTDIEGQLLMAEIQAENLNDLSAAAISIQRICNQPGHTPRNVALGLNMLADWYLKFHQDRDAAREALEKIIELLPDSEMSALASQRIARLASTEHLTARHDLKKFAVVEGVQNLGLLDPKFHPVPADADAAKEAAELVAHLHSHPLDTEAREKLALIYANHYNRLDLASDQLEQLIAEPNQPQKRTVHWLNKLADLQIRHAANYDTVRATVQRIIDRFPDSAPAYVAANRITHLKLELKANEKSQAVKLGTYEQDIGLKGGSPH